MLVGGVAHDLFIYLDGKAVENFVASGPEGGSEAKKLLGWDDIAMAYESFRGVLARLAQAQGGLVEVVTAEIFLSFLSVAPLAPPAPAKPSKPTPQRTFSGKYLGNLRKVIHIFVAQEAVFKMSGFGTGSMYR